MGMDGPNHTDFSDFAFGEELSQCSEEAAGSISVKDLVYLEYCYLKCFREKTEGTFSTEKQC
jgi:hypothetical protein